MSLQSSGDESAVLWLDQIQDGIVTANQDEEEALKRGLLAKYGGDHLKRGN